MTRRISRSCSELDLSVMIRCSAGVLGATRPASLAFFKVLGTWPAKVARLELSTGAITRACGSASVCALVAFCGPSAAKAVPKLETAANNTIRKQRKRTHDRAIVRIFTLVEKNLDLIFRKLVDF